MDLLTMKHWTPVETLRSPMKTRNYFYTIRNLLLAQITQIGHAEMHPETSCCFLLIDSLVHLMQK